MDDDRFTISRKDYDELLTIKFAVDRLCDYVKRHKGICLSDMLSMLGREDVINEIDEQEGKYEEDIELGEND